MPKYQIIVTRAITTSTILDIVADDEASAKEEAIIQAWNKRNLEWRPDEVDWMKFPPYVTDAVELD